MSEIEIGEWVRTKAGIIDKVDRVIGMIENTVHLEKNSIWIDIKDIVKHSKNIIKLIETNDHVNRYRVEDISIETNEVLLDNNGFSWKTLQAKDTILTKEQFNQNCYEVEE